MKEGANMKKVKKHLLHLIHVTSICSFFLFAIGFLLALSDHFSPPTNPLASKSASTVPASPSGGMLVGLGDSLTRGIGDPEGQGYFGIAKKELQKENPKISAINLGISGQTSNDLVKQMNQRQVRETVKKADWITITIGGNDLFRSSGRLAKIDKRAAEKSRLRYEQNLNSILSSIQKENPKATIFLFGLYNPFGDLPVNEQSSKMIAEWNQTLNQVSLNYQRVIVIHTYDLFQLEPTRYLYQDHFHPNRNGYQRMAERLLQHIHSSTGEVKTVYEE